MSFSFNPLGNLIVVGVEITGPARSFVLSLALDTGATGTLISQSGLLRAGYDPAASTERFQITTGSGIEFAPRIMLVKIASLGQEHTEFPVLSHNLPPTAGVEGLLGLDFFRGLNLNIDFRNGTITLQ